MWAGETVVRRGAHSSLDRVKISVTWSKRVSKGGRRSLPAALPIEMSAGMEPRGACFSDVPLATPQERPALPGTARHR